MKLHRVKIFTIASILFTISFFFFYNIDVARNTGNETRQDKRQLFRTLFSEGAIGIYSTAADKNPSTKDLKKSFPFGFRNMKIKWIPDTAITESILSNESVLLTGSFKDKIINKILNKLKIKANNKSIQLAGKEFSGDQLSIHLICPNPYNKNKLLILNAGNNNSISVNRFVSDLEIREGNKALYLADYDYNNSSESILPVTDEILLNSARKLRAVNENIELVIESGNVKETDIKRLEKELLLAKEKFGKLFTPKNETKIIIRTYDTFEQKGLMINDTKISVIINNELQIVLNKDYPLYLNDYYKLLLKNHLGEGSCKFIEDAIAAYLAEGWNNYDKYEIAARLINADVVPSLKELSLDENYNWYSNYLIESIGALLVKFIVSKEGIDRLKNYYISFDKAFTGTFERKWKEYSKEFAINYHVKKRVNKTIPVKLKGFCFAHEGYQIHNGYLSSSAVKSMIRLKEIGTNAISITPFTGMRDPNVVSRLPIWRSAGAENDESVIFCNKEANKLGMFTLLKPHIYIHNSWPGAINFDSEDEWNIFFKYYTDWIIHYAILAQLNDIPVFVFGNELSEAALNHPDKMRELIRKIRLIYDGYLTYGANWGKEFENIEFWDKLDFIGLSEYYPLWKKETFNSNELNTGVNSIINKINLISNKYSKKVLLTEIGFRSSKSPWMNSFEPESNKRIFNPEYQAAVYKLALPKLLKSQSIIGLFIWKWPTYLEFNINQTRDMYTPLNKPAEKVIESIFTK